MEAGESPSFHPKAWSLPSFPLAHFLSHSVLMGRKTETPPQASLWGNGFILPLGNRSKNKLPSAQHFLWQSGDNLAMLEPARDLGQDRSKAVRTMDEFGQLVTFTGRALLGNQGEAQKVTCQSACSGWEGTLPWKGVTGKVTYAVLPSPK